MSFLIQYRVPWVAMVFAATAFLCLAAKAAFQKAEIPIKTPTSASATVNPPADTGYPPSGAGRTTPKYDAETPTSEDGSDHEMSRPQLERMGPPKGGHRISPKDDVWIQQKRGVVIVDGRVALRQGMLEMFACPRGTKEHESVVAVDAKAFIIHAALLNIGAEPGHPVQFAPEYHPAVIAWTIMMEMHGHPVWLADYQPAAGTEIDIQVLWVDEKGGKHIAKAQDWVRDARTEKALETPWVFVGSRFWHDKETNRDYYQAEAGDLICVSNFATAMLDLPIKSTQANEGLAFEAFTEQIPPLGTHVRLVLRPKLK